MLYTGRGGFLYEKIRTRNKKINSDEDENHNRESEQTLPDFLINDQDAEELMQFFRNCVVAHNKEELKDKMKSSVAFRRNILKNPPEPMFKIFGFYFVDPELVCFFFHLLCTSIGNYINHSRIF